MEIERKYLVRSLPENLASCTCHHIEQAYICVNPVIRIRLEDDSCYLTCKGQGMLSREECNLPMDLNTYRHLLTKAEGTVITKDRYLIPLSDGLCAELDCFHGAWEGLIIVEVEFPDLDSARTFSPPGWFGEDVTFDPKYHNSWMSRHTSSE